MDELQAQIVLPAAFKLELQNQTRQIVQEELSKIHAQANEPEYMNIAQACRYVGVSRNTLAKYVDDGLKITMIDKVRRIRREDLDAYMDSKAV